MGLGISLLFGLPLVLRERHPFADDFSASLVFRLHVQILRFKSWSTVQMFEIDCTRSIWPRFRRLGFIKLLTCRIYSAPIASSLSLISGFSCRTMFNKDLWTSIFPLYSIKPNLRNLFMKKLTRDRVVPIISASIS